MAQGGADAYVGLVGLGAATTPGSVGLITGSSHLHLGAQQRARPRIPSLPPCPARPLRRTRARPSLSGQRRLPFPALLAQRWWARLRRALRVARGARTAARHCRTLRWRRAASLAQGRRCSGWCASSVEIATRSRCRSSTPRRSCSPWGPRASACSRPCRARARPSQTRERAARCSASRCTIRERTSGALRSRRSASAPRSAAPHSAAQSGRSPTPLPPPPAPPHRRPHPRLPRAASLLLPLHARTWWHAAVVQAPLPVLA